MSDIYKILTARVWLYIGIGVALAIILAGAWCASGCDTPLQEPHVVPVVAYFYEYPWELMDSTTHHCPQSWDTRLYLPGEEITLHGRRTRYPFAVDQGVSPPLILSTEADTFYTDYEIHWKACSCDKWENLRTVTIPGSGVMWVQWDGAVAGDIVRVIEPPNLVWP
jgi:uncharacterized membrane protein